MGSEDSTTATAATATATDPSAAIESGSGCEASITPPTSTIRSVQTKCLMNARYHAAREAFLDSVHRWFMFGVVASGAGAVTGFASFLGEAEWLNAVFGTLAAVLGALDLTFDLANRARMHALMKRRYFELMADLEEGQKSIAQVEVCVHRYAADEEPAYHALLTASWNAAQEMVYGDKEDQYNIPWFHRKFQNFFRFEGVEYAFKNPEKST